MTEKSQNDKSQKIKILVVLAIFILGLGAVALGTFTNVIYHPLAFKLDSEPVTGTVQKSTVVRRVPGKPTREGYVPKVTYKYTYEGAAYTNDRWKPGGTYRYESEGKASSMADVYRKGEEVTVYVRPGEPQDSVLTLTSPRPIQWVMFVGSFLGTLLMGTAFVKVVTGEAVLVND